MRSERLLVDTAVAGEVAQAVATGAVSGVTTNPKLAEGADAGSYVSLMRTIATAIIDNSPWLRGKARAMPGVPAVTPYHLSIEPTLPVSSLEFVDEAIALQRGVLESIDRRSVAVYVKVPVCARGLAVISSLWREGIAVNATCVMTALAATLAVRSGASIASFFFNRMVDGTPSEVPRADARRLALEQVRAFTADGGSAICGSIRTPGDIVDCWEAGAIVTAPPKVIVAAIEHPKALEAIAEFERAGARWHP